MSVIKQATPPARRSSPKVGTLLGLGALAGVLLAMAVVLALEKFDMRLRSADDAASVLGLQLLVHLPPRAADAGGARLDGPPGGPPRRARLSAPTATALAAGGPGTAP